MCRRSFFNMKYFLVFLLLAIHLDGIAQRLQLERLYTDLGRSCQRAQYDPAGNLLVTRPYSDGTSWNEYFSLLTPSLDTIWSKRGYSRVASGGGWLRPAFGGYAYSNFVRTTRLGDRTDVVLKRYSADLRTLRWSRQYDLGYGAEDGSYGLLTVPDGYLLNISAPNFSRGRTWWGLMKTDTLGNVLWKKFYGWSINDFAAETRFTPSGNIIMVGQTSSTALRAYQLKMLLLNPNGDSLRSLSYSPLGLQRVFTMNYNDNGRVLPLSDQGFLVLGKIDSTNANSLPILVKVDANLQPQWTYVHREAQRQMPGTNDIVFAGSCELTDGSVLVLAYFNYVPYPPAPFYLLRLSAGGQLLNKYVFNSGLCPRPQFTQLLPLADTAVYVLGGCTAGPGTGQAYAARISLRGLPGIVTGTAAPHPRPGAVGLEAPFPNPAEGRVTLGYRRPPGSPASRLLVRTLLGQLVRELPVPAGGSGTAGLDVALLPAGVYSCTLLVPGNPPAVRRLVVAH